MIVLYSTHCPNCRALERKLEEKHIEYTVIDDLELMKQLNIKSAPQLQIDGGELLNFSQAYKWLKEQE